MKIHILTDDRVKKRGFLAEHGMSIFIEHGENNILFDTGQSYVFTHNAALMGIDLTKTNCIVLSHGHYDHCGGLIHFHTNKKMPTIYVNKNAFAKKYVEDNGTNAYREIGIPWSLENFKEIKKNIVFTKDCLNLENGVNLCAGIPSTNSFEDIPKGFHIKEDNSMIADMMQDEQMLILENNSELDLFLGCSHKGIVNCINHALNLFPNKKIRSLTAGMHLENVSPIRLEMTIKYLLDIDIQKVIPLHCTGIRSICEIKRFLGNRCLDLCAGDSIKI